MEGYAGVAVEVYVRRHVSLGLGRGRLPVYVEHGGLAVHPDYGDVVPRPYDGQIACTPDVVVYPVGRTIELEVIEGGTACGYCILEHPAPLVAYDVVLLYDGLSSG